MSESKQEQNHIRQDSFSASLVNHDLVNFEEIQVTSDINEVDREPDPSRLIDHENMADKSINSLLKNMHVTQSVLEPPSSSN
jgi:hypothetical protein